MINKINMYTCFTESHKCFYDKYFIPSIPKEFNVITKVMDQKSATGAFGSDLGWQCTLVDKVEFIIDLYMDEMNAGNQWFLYSDPDIQFFDSDGFIRKDLQKYVDKYQFAAMDDNMLCAGFWVSRVNEKMRNMWIDILELMKQTGTNEQILLNHILKEPTTGISYGKLDRFTYFNYMHTIGHYDKVWDGKEQINMSREQFDQIKMHHANYTIGVDNKMCMMEIIHNAKS